MQQIQIRELQTAIKQSAKSIQVSAGNRAERRANRRRSETSEIDPRRGYKPRMRRKLKR